MIYTLGSEAKQTEYYTLTVTHTTILQTFLVDLCSPAEAFMAEQVKTRAVAWPNLDVVSWCFYASKQGGNNFDVFGRLSPKFIQA